MATSDDGVHWHRGAGDVQGTRRADDVGACLRGDAENWWTLDTNAVALGDVQLFSSDVVQGGAAGVYWMFYTGVDFQPLAAPAGLPNMGVAAGAEMEGLCARPGLAMSQARSSCRDVGAQDRSVHLPRRAPSMQVAVTVVAAC